MKKRIACITEYPFPGEAAGAEIIRRDYFSELMSQLAGNGWKVDIYTQLTDLHQPRILQFGPGIRIIHLPSERISNPGIAANARFQDRFGSEVITFITNEQLRYDLVHANFLMSGQVAIALKNKFKIPFVFTFRALGQAVNLENQLMRMSGTRIKIEQQIVRKADLIVVESPQDKADLMHFSRTSAKKTFIIPAGINPAKFFPIEKLKARKSLKLDPNERILLQIAEFNSKSGFDNVIKSLALLDAAAEKIRLIIVGLGNELCKADTDAELSKLKRLAEDLGLSKQITFHVTANLDKTALYYAAADLFVTTPLSKGSSDYVLEAMACGTPVIGSEIGVIKFAVAEGRTGFLIPPKAPEVLADRIILMLKNDALLSQMSRNSAQYVHSGFTWAKVAEQMADLYEYVLLTKTLKLQHSKPVQLKPVNRSVPLRNAYLKRNLQAKYGS